MNIATKRIALLTLTATFSAGIHAALVPEHLREKPSLGYSFILAAILGLVISWGLVTHPDDRRLPTIALLFLTGEILAWALCVTVQVPAVPETPEPIEAIALITKAVELFGVIVGLPLVGYRENQDGSRSLLARRSGA